VVVVASLWYARRSGDEGIGQREWYRGIVHSQQEREKKVEKQKAMKSRKQREAKISSHK